MKHFAAAALPQSADLIAIYAAGAAGESIICVVRLTTLAQLFGRPVTSTNQGRLAVSAELDDKFAEVISAKYKEHPYAFTSNQDQRNRLLRYELTLDDLRSSGQKFSGSVLDAPAMAWGKDGKF